jgi:hypothetical protein
MDFPTLWKLVQCEASRRVVEVGCEHFFLLSRYISLPKRTWLGVRNYERIAMLSSWCMLILSGLHKSTCIDAKLVYGKRVMIKMLSNAGTWNNSWKQPHLDNQNQLN